MLCDQPFNANHKRPNKSLCFTVLEEEPERLGKSGLKRRMLIYHHVKEN